jgi:hypothetical protein
VAAAAIVKIGSTSTTMLLAARLAVPLVREQRLINLFSEKGRSEVLVWASALAAQARRWGVEPLAAGGQGLRAHPELEQRLEEIFPRWWHLTPALEGRLAWAAVKAAVPACDVVVDIGGGSTEIVTHQHVWSVEVGAVNGDFTQPWPPLHALHHPVFIGGTAVTLSRWAERSELQPEHIRGIRRQLETSPQQFSHWEPLRHSILPRGLSIMEQVAALGGWDTFSVSDRGLTEGLWMAASLGRGGRS